ncbi:hypothetical protein ACOSQ3_007051 [Xanthoceras sorbifolium]
MEVGGSLRCWADSSPIQSRMISAYQGNFSFSAMLVQHSSDLGGGDSGGLKNKCSGMKNKCSVKNNFLERRHRVKRFAATTDGGEGGGCLSDASMREGDGRRYGGKREREMVG